MTLQETTYTQELAPRSDEASNDDDEFTSTAVIEDSPAGNYDDIRLTEIDTARVEVHAALHDIREMADYDEL